MVLHSQALQRLTLAGAALPEGNPAALNKVGSALCRLCTHKLISRSNTMRNIYFSYIFVLLSTRSVLRAFTDFVCALIDLKMVLIDLLDPVKQ